MAAVHFLDASCEQTLDICSLVISLAYQVACRVPGLKKTVLTAAQDLSRDEPPVKLFERLVIRPACELNDRAAKDPGALPVKGSVVLLIDGLDVAKEGSSQSDLLSIIVKGCESLPPWIRFVLTSRPDAGIKGGLATLQHFLPSRVVEAGRGQPELHKADLSVFVQGLLQNKASVKMPVKKPAEVPDDVTDAATEGLPQSAVTTELNVAVEKIVERSIGNGDFNFAELAVASTQKCVDGTDVATYQFGDVENGLDGEYERVFMLQGLLQEESFCDEFTGKKSKVKVVKPMLKRLLQASVLKPK